MSVGRRASSWQRVVVQANCASQVTRQWDKQSDAWFKLKAEDTALRRRKRAIQAGRASAATRAGNEAERRNRVFAVSHCRRTPSLGATGNAAERARGNIFSLAVRAFGC